MEDLLTNYPKVWDVVFLVDKEEVVINRSLPVVESLFGAGLPDRTANKEFLYWKDLPFIILLTVMTRTIPVPLTVDVMKTIVNIAQLAQKKVEE